MTTRAKTMARGMGRRKREMPKNAAKAPDTMKASKAQFVKLYTL